MEQLQLVHFVEAALVGVVLLWVLETCFRLLIGRDTSAVPGPMLAQTLWSDLFKRRLGEKPFTGRDTEQVSWGYSATATAAAAVLGLTVQGVAANLDYGHGMKLSRLLHPGTEELIRTDVFYAGRHHEAGWSDYPLSFADRYVLIVREHVVHAQAIAPEILATCIAVIHTGGDATAAQECRDQALAVYYVVKNRLYAERSRLSELLEFDHSLSFLQALSFASLTGDSVIVGLLIGLLFDWLLSQLYGRVQTEQTITMVMTARVSFGVVGLLGLAWFVGGGWIRTHMDNPPGPVLWIAVGMAFLSSIAAGLGLGRRNLDSIAYLRWEKVVPLAIGLAGIGWLSDYGAYYVETERAKRIYGYGLELLKAEPSTMIHLRRITDRTHPWWGLNKNPCGMISVIDRCCEPLNGPRTRGQDCGELEQSCTLVAHLLDSTRRQWKDIRVVCGWNTEPRNAVATTQNPSTRTPNEVPPLVELHHESSFLSRLREGGLWFEGGAFLLVLLSCGYVSRRHDIRGNRVRTSLDVVETFVREAIERVADKNMLTIHNVNWMSTHHIDVSGPGIRMTAIVFEVAELVRTRQEDNDVFVARIYLLDPLDGQGLRDRHDILVRDTTHRQPMITADIQLPIRPWGFRRAKLASLIADRLNRTRAIG